MRRITKAGLQRRIAAARSRLADVVAGRTATGPDARIDASFTAWLERGEGAHFVGFPSRWRVDEPQLTEPAPLGVHFHVYYEDLVAEVAGQLANIPVPFDLIVTNASGRPLDRAQLAASGARHIRILEVENRGRDIWPLVQVVNAGYLDPYDLVFKVHTKKSAWRQEHATLAGSGQEWKEGFYRDLLGSGENIEQIITALLGNPQLGVVTSQGSIARADQWGGDEHIASHLLHRLRLAYDRDALEFPSGSIYWIRGFILQGLRSLLLDAADFEDEAGQIDGTAAHAIERLIGILALEAGYAIRERADLPQTQALEPGAAARLLAEPQLRAKAVAFYLPQFHTFPENDAWWGEGFTEWTNVTKAQPVYQGQPQPLLPGELGFYDLRLDEVRQRQSELARRYGVHAFMYYHYWFAGHRLMEMPIRRLAESDLDQPFCIMWANENWTRRWDGDTKNVLIAQEYDKVPAEQFIDDVLPYLLDERYLRIDGAAVLAVYRIAQIPDYKRVIEHWRTRAREAGAGELHLLSVDVGENFDGLSAGYQEAGVQGALAFPPHNHSYVPLSQNGYGVVERFQGGFWSYAAMAQAAERRLLGELPASDLPGAMVGFDNTARRQWQPDVWVGANPYTFRRWLRACVAAVADRDEEHRIVIVNAWNEWAEGAVLEPTARWGSTYLQALRAALL